MNIFDNYLIEINDIILGNKDILNLENLENLNNINLEIPPEHFDFDLSTNVSLVLAKGNKINPNSLANSIKDLLLKINHFEIIEVAGLVFLNIKLSKEGIANNIYDILENRDLMAQKIK